MNPKKAGKTKKFRPSKKMMELVQIACDPAKEPTIISWCREIGINKSAYYRWFRDLGFVRWFDTERSRLMTRQMAYLDNVALKRALKDYRYWDALKQQYSEFKGVQENLKISETEDLSTLTDQELVNYRNALKKIKSSGKELREKSLKD